MSKIILKRVVSGFMILLMVVGIFVATSQNLDASCSSDWVSCRQQAMKDYDGLSLALHLTACDIGRFKCEMKL